MSKAFTRESDDAAPELPFVPDLDLGPGEKNYMTPAGAARLREEVARLRAAPRGDASERAALEHRLAALAQRLELVEIVTAPATPPERVLFGTTVTVRDEEGATRRFCIVGIDEADAKQRRVSWRSPIAQALLGHGLGEAVTLPTAAGASEHEIVAIDRLPD